MNTQDEIVKRYPKPCIAPWDEKTKDIYPDFADFQERSFGDQEFNVDRSRVGKDYVGESLSRANERTREEMRDEDMRKFKEAEPAIRPGSAPNGNDSVGQYLIKIDDRIHGINAVIESLANSLTGVLGPMPSNPAMSTGGLDEATPERSPLAAELDDICDRLYRIHNTLENLAKRNEL